ncbi:hypothetical protein [Actinoplanes sp. NBRC 101535]|uniref:NACHT domain-containing protein n=1 Tax=Actinoplanes sp. NBRC 101535 TaxID=3032196 RepID=UPI0024A511E8|nr:hypothetical protein [Actinoplanes sp. NBRC 101535]GLX99709.1 hypothetical protein Acsp01_00890 [Actinoplanes sp. NBRC 101535]
MQRGLTYHDALKLLGGSGPFMRITDNVLGGALAVATAGGSEVALSLFDAKGEAVRLGHLVTDKITELVRGHGRHSRSRRLQAAHGVLVVGAFFEALDVCLGAAGLDEAGLTRAEQAGLVAAAALPADWPSRLLAARIPAPGPDQPYDRLLAELRDWFRATTGATMDHLAKLAAWDGRADLAEPFRRVLPDLALTRYEDGVRRLAAEAPEFGIWMRLLADRAATRGLADLEHVLLRVTSHRDPARHRAALALTYRAELGQPVLGGDSGELVLPAIAAGYLDPAFRVKTAGPGAHPAVESWWDTEPRDDLATFLATYLTTPQAADAPLLLLGQAGSGKSALTRVLAARLPAADFLVVRVVLRKVRAEAEIQDQIEQALRTTIGETVAWPELARDADAAMPVVLLDGFDELLQATGIHQSDYLQRVAAFQQREATLGRPVAVMVTSRTVVADRARVPHGSLVVRLEPFGEAHLERWLEIWNHTNAARWTDGRRPLTMDVLRRFPDLAVQPLLLLMLALYDAGDNALHDAGDELGTGQLYERLLREFATREVRRVHGAQPDTVMPALVEDELLRLSVVAFAMFHRLRLWVTTEELDADLAGLGLQPARRSTQDFRTPLTAGQEMVGRFFFIQRAQASQDDQTRQTYEFLHATFGEYLVARLVVQALADVTARSRARTLRLGQAEDDELLQSLLGYTPLCARATVLPFAAELLDRAGAAEIREWIVERLRTAVTRPQHTPRSYRPVDKRADHWMHTYSFNLTLLALACGGPLRASELFQRAEDPAGRLRDTALQWRAAVPGGMFLDAMDTITVDRTWTADRRRDLVLTRRPQPSTPSGPSAPSAPSAASGSASSVVSPSVASGSALSSGDLDGGVDLLWSHKLTEAVDRSDWTGLQPALTSMRLSGALSDDILRHALEPVLQQAPELVFNLVAHGGNDAESPARSLIGLAMASHLAADHKDLLTAYERAVTAVTSSGLDASARALGVAVVLRALAGDEAVLTPDQVSDLRRRLSSG